MKKEILRVSRQDTIAELSPWFDKQLEKLIEKGNFLKIPEIEQVRDGIVSDLADYRGQSGLDNVVLGMSGGVDSALTAALFKEAGWNVAGLMLPINQNPEETARGFEACDALGIDGIEFDLTKSFEQVRFNIKPTLEFNKSKQSLIRQGNMRARLRMITLYDAANAVGGLVASTDNFSELTAGFWTLHGDVGDLSPIQSLWKSWEVPEMARLAGVPESIYTATPTDGLGIDAGDEAQFGCSYLEWDIMVMSVLSGDLCFGSDDRANEVHKLVVDRMSKSAFKRYNPGYLKNKLDPGRFDQLEELDNTWKPEVLK